MEPTEEHLSVLKKYFGHKEFRPMQWQIIRSIIVDRRDNCVVMATGYGKSLCYQYPPVFCQGLGIVVSPLISLMQDQVLSLKMCNIPACFLGSAQTSNSDKVEGLFSGIYRLVYVTPEWCTNDHGRSILERLVKENVNVSLIAIDEAHCVSQWGFDFRKSYRNLRKLRTTFPKTPLLTLTATATPQVRSDICSSLGLRNPQKICTSFDRPNLYLCVSLKSPDMLSDLRNLLMQEKIRNNSCGSTIIYCPTKKTADRIHTLLRSAGFNCGMYHADLNNKVRERVHEEFVKDIVPIIVATVAFGMGIDKPDVRTVVHYGAPKDLESYYQEIGRAGRDGLPALCHAFYAQTDFTLNKSFLSSLSGDFKVHKEDMERLMEKYLQSSDCRRRFILRHFSPNSQLKIEDNPESCCDNCTTKKKEGKEKPTFHHDLTDDATLLLKAIKEMNGYFGLTIAIYLLRGSVNKRLPQRYYQSKMYGVGRTKTEQWWKLLGGLMIRESLLEETISNFGQGWNKNNFPVKLVKISTKGEHFLITNGENAHLEPTPEMLTLMRTMPKFIPKETNEGWEFTSYENSKSQEVSSDNSSQPLSLEDHVFEELLKFRSSISQRMECMPYMVFDNRTIQDLSQKRPTTLDEISKIEGITEAKIKNFGNECLECIKKAVESSKPSQLVSKKTFIKKFVRKAPLQKFRYEDESETGDGCHQSNSREDEKEMNTESADNITKSVENITENFFIDDDDDFDEADVSFVLDHIESQQSGSCDKNNTNEPTTLEEDGVHPVGRMKRNSSEEKEPEGTGALSEKHQLSQLAKALLEKKKGPKKKLKSFL